MAGTPDPMAVLRGHHAEVQALDFLETDQALITGDAEGEVRAWDLQTLRPVALKRAHPTSGGVIHLQAFTWRGQQYLVTQGKDMTFDVWHLGTDLQLSREPLHSIHNLAASFCRFSLLLISTDGGPQLQRNAQTAEAATTSAAGSHSMGASSAAEPSSSQPSGPNPAREQLVIDAPPAAVSAGGPTAIPVPALEHECRPRDSSGSGCGSSGSGGALLDPAPLLAVPASDNSSAEVWCCGCGQLLATVGQGAATDERKLGMCTSLRLFRCPASGKIRLAAGYEAGWVAVWAVEAGAAAAPPIAARHLHTEPVLALDMDGSGAAGVSGGADARLVFFKLGSEPGAIKVRHAAALKSPGVSDVAIRSDGRIVATAGWDGRVRVFKYWTAEPLAILKYHQSAVAAVSFSPRTNLLASASRDGTVALWSIYQQQQKKS